MLEVIFLNISDALFYERHDFSEQVISGLQESLSPYMVYIAGPKSFSLEEELPIYIGLKENSVDNKEVNTNRNGYFIFSNIVTGDIHLNKLYENDKFQPRGKKNIKRPRGAPVDYVPLKTTSYDADYVSILKNELPSTSGSWALFEHSGSFVSNIHQIEIQQDQSDISEKLSSDNIDPHRSRMNIGFESTNMNSKIPSSGISLSPLSLKATTNKQPLVIFGSFAVDKAVDISAGFLPINLLITGKQFKYLEIITLKVPANKIDLSSDLRKGFFSLDLQTIFYSEEFGNRTLEDDFYITAVSGATVSKVLPVVGIKKN